MDELGRRAFLVTTAGLAMAGMGRRSVDGTAEVPVALELAFRRGGRLDGVEPVSGIPDAFLLRANAGRYMAQDRDFGVLLSTRGSPRPVRPRPEALQDEIIRRTEHTAF